MAITMAMAMKTVQCISEGKKKFITVGKPLVGRARIFIVRCLSGITVSDTSIMGTEPFEEVDLRSAIWWGRISNLGLRL